MILGRIVGRTSTTNFNFLVEGDAKKFQYAQLMHRKGIYILAQIIEIEKDADKALAYCEVIGFRDEENVLRPLRTPLEPGAEVLQASDDFVKKTLGLEAGENSAYIGNLEGRKNLKVYLDLNKLLTRHVAILAKSGSGKSHTAGCLIEELLEKKIPVVIIDPHGEYSTLKQPNLKDKERIAKFGVKPKGFLQQVIEFSPDPKSNLQAKPLKLNSKNLTPTEFIHLLPSKLSNAQLTALYSSIKNLGGKADFTELIFELESSESNARWGLISILEYVQKLNLFSEDYTLMGELVQPGKAAVINLKGIPPELQEVIVYKILKDLFVERKDGNIPPFFLVVEEGQSFIPERSYGEKKSSAILRQIFAEGRKFGLGVCLISQRPSRVEKNALAQATTQIILKTTNPNDVKTISNSVEGINLAVEKEIKNIPIGTAMITGVVDLPLFVNVRPRMSKHGGEAVQIFKNKKNEEEENVDFVGEVENFKKLEILPLIKPKISPKDLRLMSNEKINIKTTLNPCALYTCYQNGENFNLLVDLSKAEVITNVDDYKTKPLLKVEGVSPQQNKVLQAALQLNEFKPAELFAKSGVQFSELYDIVNILTNKGHLIKVGEKYNLSEPLQIFSKLKKLACFEKVEYANIKYDEKIEKKYEVGEIRSFLNKFLEVKNMKECWLINHAPT